MFNYLVIENEITSLDNGTYKSYGIKVMKKTNREEYEIEKVIDISTDFQFVKNLSLLCTKLNLSPIHLLNVIEDSIG